MRVTVTVLSLLGLALWVQGEAIGRKEEEEQSLLDCAFDDDAIGCLRTRLARDIDSVEEQVTGKKGEPPMSAVIEQAGNFAAEVVDDIQNPGRAEDVEGEGDQQVEARKKKFGKKKKKHLRTLLDLGLMLKAKLSLLLQLVSTHFQIKTFMIMILAMIVNGAKFWLELKSKHNPSKVIYYEHAQHQHHYDHDEHDHGYWGRSSNDSPQNLAYSAQKPSN